jgi:hypothetical protein
MKMQFKKVNFDVKLKLSNLQKAIDDPAKALLIPSLVIIENDIKERIQNRKKLDDSGQKQNKPSTIVKKGHNVPLIDSGKYYNSHFKKSTVGKYKAEMRPPPERESTVYHLIQKGYSTFGISEKAYNKMMILARNLIDKIVERYWK